MKFRFNRIASWNYSNHPFKVRIYTMIIWACRSRKKRLTIWCHQCWCIKNCIVIDGNKRWRQRNKRHKIMNKGKKDLNIRNIRPKLCSSSSHHFTSISTKYKSLLSLLSRSSHLKRNFICRLEENDEKKNEHERSLWEIGNVLSSSKVLGEKGAIHSRLNHHRVVRLLHILWNNMRFWWVWKLFSFLPYLIDYSRLHLASCCHWWHLISIW